MAAALVLGRFRWSAERTGLIHNPLTQENRKKLIHYTRYAIKAGFLIIYHLPVRYFLPVVLTIKDNNHIQINSYRKIPNLSPMVLEESFSAYKKCALQDSLYTQIKMGKPLPWFLRSPGRGAGWAWSLIARKNKRISSKSITTSQEVV
jgi:hypothetical protein